MKEIAPDSGNDLTLDGAVVDRMQRKARMSSTLRIFVSLLVFPALIGCSLLTKIEDECTDDTECTSRGANLQCVANLCVEGGSSSIDADVGDENDADDDTHEGPLMPEDLLSMSCNRVDGVPLDQPLPDNAIVIGAILPLTGQLALAGPFFMHATLLAVEEINSIGGLLGRDLVMVTCDSGTDPTTAVAAAQHLSDLGIQAVIGPFSSAIVIDVFEDVFRNAGVAIITAGATSPIMENISSEGLIWSTSLPAARQAEAIAVHLLNNDYQKIAVVNRDDPWGNGMREAMHSVYCEQMDCTDTDHYLPRVYDTDDLIGSLPEVALGLSSFDPDVTVMLTYTEDAIVFINTIASMDDVSLQSFIWNDALGGELAFSEVNEQAHQKLCQVMGTTAALPDNAVYDLFLMRYRAQWSEFPVPYATNFYDAVYMLSYAIAAATTERIAFTGFDIGAAMERLSAGPSIEAGTSDWHVGIQALRASKQATIDYMGASGDLDFVSGTGSVTMPVEAYRLNVEDQELNSLGTIYDTDDVYTPPDYTNIQDSACAELAP